MLSLPSEVRTMISKEKAIELGDAPMRPTLYHRTARNRDGSAARCRVSGKCQTWKRDPERWQLPARQGLRYNFYIRQDNAHEWLTYDPTDTALRSAMERYGMGKETPWQIVHDRLLDDNRADLARTVADWKAIAIETAWL